MILRSCASLLSPLFFFSFSFYFCISLVFTCTKKISITLLLFPCLFFLFFPLSFLFFLFFFYFEEISIGLPRCELDTGSRLAAGAVCS